MTKRENEFIPKSDISNGLVVVHKADGTLIKGRLECAADSAKAIPFSPLPGVLHVRGVAPDECFLIQTCETKAVFFVKRHEGTLDHDDVKFFSDIAATDLWIRLQFADGEVLEGQMENDKRLLVDPGLWLRPVDTAGNNILVYIPKSAVVEFHVMGVAIHRQQDAVTAAVDRASVKTT
jgi:Family of unknown function (DUF6982)